MMIFESRLGSVPFLKYPVTWIAIGSLLVVSGILTLLFPEQSHRLLYNRWLFPLSYSQKWAEDPKRWVSARRSSYFNIVFGLGLIALMLWLMHDRGVGLTDPLR